MKKTLSPASTRIHNGFFHALLPSDTHNLTYLPNANVILVPDPISGWWRDTVHWIVAFVYAAGVILAGLTSRSEECSEKEGPGPCFFHFFSHWCYIWMALQFYLYGLARFSWLIRRFLHFTTWFTVGTSVTWAIMTTILLLTLRKTTIESLLPSDDGDVIGFGVVAVCLLHFWPVFHVCFIYVPQYGQRMGVFFIRLYSWLILNFPRGLGAVIAFLAQLALWFSPVLAWGFYLIWWDPYKVYDIANRFAKHFPVAYVIALTSVFFSGLFLGWYLHSTVKALIAKRIAEYAKTDSRFKHLI